MRAAAIVLALSSALAAELSLQPITRQPRQGRLLEVRVEGVPQYPNPYDPAVVALDLEVVAPDGHSVLIPAFHMAPYTPHRHPPRPRRVRNIRIFINAANWPKAHTVEFLLDDITLHDTAHGRSVALDDFERGIRWTTQAATATLDTANPRSGRRALRVRITVGERRWPGISLRLGPDDWSAFDQLRLWIRPIAGLDRGVPTIEYWTPDGHKAQQPIRVVEKAAPGQWHQFTWRLPSIQPPLEWRPAGKPSWRARFRPAQQGTYRLRARLRDQRGQTLSPWLQLRVATGHFPGYLRPSPDDPRYLAFTSGRPFFPVGINLIGRDLDTYRRYLAPLAAAGGNFIRIWLSPRTLGIETKTSGPTRYGQDRAAQLDALLALCQKLGIHIMACISDFREVASFHQGTDWPNSPYNAANGGPCRRPEDFFTDPRAKAQYKAKLRYLVARYSHSPNILAWEFFNEVNITDAWRKNPQAVRDWHAEMAAYLRSIDPARHIITSSFAGIPDDPLWEQPLMEIVQRHQYTDAQVSFTHIVASAHQALRHHRKPILMGEFGRRKNRYAALDARGLSLHNALWTSVLAGGCGTAMSWWWQWIEENNLWPQLTAIATYVRDINWPGERFQPHLAIAIRATPDPKHGFGPLTLAPSTAGFRATPHDKPVTVRISPAGKPDHPDLLPRILHGTRNHPDLHNPLTLHTNFPRPTTFSVGVRGVSGHGGAALRIALDGKTLLHKQLPDTDPAATQTITAYNAPYTIPLPAGPHTIAVENTGNDWLIVGSYRFNSGRPTPPLRAYALRGKRTVLIWLWNETHPWHLPIYHGTHVIPRNVRLEVRDLPPGRWRIQRYDTWAGRWTHSLEATIARDRPLTLQAGDLATDTAWRLTHLTP